MATIEHLPPLDGSIDVLPGFLDFHARYNPDLPWATFPSPKDPTVASTISFLELSQGSHRVAHLVRPKREGNVRETVVLLINTDSLLYVTMIVGIARAGFVPFPVSYRNSPEAVAYLLEKTSCRHVITQTGLTHLLSAAQTSYASQNVTLRVDELPSIYDIFPSPSPGQTIEAADELLYPEIERARPEDLAIYMHSAGSTGLPKPIPLSQKVFLQWIRNPMFTGSRDHRIKWAAMALPTFHSMGVLAQLMAPLISGQTVGLYEPKSPGPPVVPNPKNVLDVARLANCNAIISVPSFIELWAESEETIKYLASLKILFFGGGPLSVENGNKLIKAGVRLVSAYGCTEAGPVAHPFDGYDSDGSDPNARTSEDWQWQGLSPLCKLRWVPQGDGTYELQFLTCEAHQPSVENLPDTKGYATSDLWIPHPHKKGLWRIVGRKDDVIVLGSGEKIVPIPQERYIASHPLISDVVMFGRGRQQAGVLVEPVPQCNIDPNDKIAVSRFRDEIWSYIDQANQKAPTFARIFREMVLICDPAKPLPRAAKGNVVRKHALELYAHAIEHLYDRSEISQGSTLSSPTSWTVQDIETWLLALTASVNNGQPLLAAVDIFEQGLDSLHVTFIRNHIISALRLSRNLTSVVISQNFIYDHPTIHNLAAAIFEIVNPKSDSQETKETRQADQINELIKKYSRDLPKANTKVTPPADKVVVLLTGPTGSLGSHLLADLLEDDRVSKVYALSRPSPQSIERQRTSFLDRGLPTHLLSHNKYAPISGDFNWNNFGLEQAIFKEIQGSVSHIIHNAWKVDFNHGLSSFESQITGTRKLVDFCFNLDRPVRLLFMSSIGVAQGWDNQSGPIPETPLSDPGLATDSGYSASKYVVEQVLSQAHTNGLEATSLRIGQVCGSRSTGAWNITDWVPILVKSSMAMGKLPVIDEPVTWLPVDVVARATVDLLFSKSELPTLVNMIHPRPVAWEDIINAINQNIGTTLSVVSLDEWVDALELLSSSATPQDLTNIPAVKLIEFFRSLKESSERNSSTGEPGSHNTFETSKLVTFSQTMRELPSISREHVVLWMKYWRKKGYIN